VVRTVTDLSTFLFLSPIPEALVVII